MPGGAGDATAIARGRVDSHGSPLVNRLQRTLAPVTAHPVSRALREGDLVAGFEVLEVPGHSPGALAFWRERDRVLVCGDVLANFSLRPTRPRLVLAPAALSSDYEQNRRSAARLAELRPRLACFGHGFALTDPDRFATAIQQLGPAPTGPGRCGEPRAAAGVADLGQQAVQGRLVGDRPGDDGHAGFVAADLQALEPGRPAALQHPLDADLIARWRLGWRSTA
jgi:glyoxylase-like metal-dependent hydrolase (beta-lactamase superfamily II)